METLTVLLLIAAAAYFLPALLALARDHHQRLAIFVLNLFAGWSVIGWFAALVWACTAVRRPEVEQRFPRSS